MANEIVAQARSKYGGKCQHPTHNGPPIRRDDVIYKIAGTDKTTAQGQGPGFWVCEICVKEYGDDG